MLAQSKAVGKVEECWEAWSSGWALLVLRTGGGSEAGTGTGGWSAAVLRVWSVLVLTAYGEASEATEPSLATGRAAQGEKISQTRVITSQPFHGSDTHLFSSQMRTNQEADPFLTLYDSSVFFPPHNLALKREVIQIPSCCILPD